MGPMAGLDGCGKSRPQRDSIPGKHNPHPVAVPTEVYRPTGTKQVLLDTKTEQVISFWLTSYTNKSP